MYLKNLTMMGFKSFADKTVLNFQPGVTAIVGPNGCGKSNVSDGIRWVLGEQSAKALRGGEMADVIFNGTDTRKPLSLAEVSLTIGGVEEEQLKAAGVDLSYNEITVTRRVYRDGGSEYFINKTNCRLRDIQQLFMGTGVGRASYSIMAQGNITQILSSKPDDRRMVFEEAAGITKFKSQKKEALRKLEHTDQNLLRVADLIREVKRQIGSLQRQAGKARRFKQLLEDQKKLETHLARHQFDQLQGEIKERDSGLEKLRIELEVCSESVLRGEGEIGQLRERLTELEGQIHEAQQRGQELKSQVDRHESRVHYNEERLRELEAQNARATSDITQAEERRRVAEEELVVVTERLAVSSAALEQQRDTLAERQQALQKVENDLRAKQESLRQVQSEAFTAGQQLGKARQDINTLDLQKQGNVVRLEKLGAEKVQLEEERTRLEARLNDFELNAEVERLDVQTRRGTVEERQQRLREIQQEITQVTQQLDGFLRQQAEKRSRLQVLEQLQADHEGFGAGALTILKNAREVVGSLTDKIRVPDEHVMAIESALGHHLQLVLTAQPEAAQKILSELYAAKKGRASIGALDLAAESQPPAPSAEALPGTPAMSVVAADPAVHPLVQGLLGRTLIVQDLAAATDAWRQTRGAYDYVTVTGDLLSRHGVYTGGSAAGSGKAPSSILGRKNQIAELQATMTQLQEQVTEVSRQKGALQSEQTELQASLQEAQSELRSQEVAIATRQGELKALQNSHQVLLRKIDAVGIEWERLESQEQEGLQRREALAARLGELEYREQDLQQALAELGAGLETLRQQRDAANGSLTETKVSLASEEQLWSALHNEKRPLEQRIKEMIALAEQRRNEIGSFLSRKVQAETEIAESQQKIEGLKHEREINSVQTSELLGQRSAQDKLITGREENLRGQRRRQTELQQQIGAIEVSLAQKTMAMQNLRERIQQKYQLVLDEVEGGGLTLEAGENGALVIHSFTLEEGEKQGLATDWAAIADHVAVLQKRLDEIGPVNLVAIEEYEETEQRHQFLTAQNDDLVKAKEQLMEVINRINTQTKEMFTETFLKIRDNFRVLFTEIFGGGRADLILVNEGDVLESGIDIVARPPGKQLQSITLLSGGEQTMTAVALLFSIYQVKPSPFCVLDELDAPLDESNINRFLRVLQRFLSHSQFVIITHNKRTMGIADILYGVTMQEQGVSRIVGVKFHKTDESTVSEAQQQATALVPPPQMETVNAEEDKSRLTSETMDVAMAK